MTNFGDRTAVYRCYGERDELLYIGVTGNIGDRFRAHAEKSWFLDVQLITLEWHDDPTAALAREAEVIHMERPKLNIVHNGDRNFRRPQMHKPTKAALRSQLQDADGWEASRTLMREMLTAAGPVGTRPGKLCVDLHSEGKGVARETIHRWLRQDERDGLVRHADRGRWIAVGQLAESGPGSSL